MSRQYAHRMLHSSVTTLATETDFEHLSNELIFKNHNNFAKNKKHKIKSKCIFMRLASRRL